ncbi:MAG: DNA replication and repair protein RecF [Candidatus Daviesbacteria bacterium]|nr:DNA replication and repair protein RecF [Candidatus Daviesbacteria bacterium]
MFLKNLKLTNFRNFSKIDLNFGKITLLVGNNAQGKSNLLESIYFLATSKSPRADKDIQLIKEGEEFVRISGQIIDDETELEIFMQKRENSQALEKRTKVNGIGRRATDYIGNLVVIHFSPEDINLVTGAPALRRWHLDLTLAQIDREYKNALNTYHTSLVSKNKILKGIKEGISKIDELDFWNEQMILAGNLITQKRQHFFEFLNSHVGKGSLGNFRFVYEESLISDGRIREYLAREIATGNSLIGPHRDDFVFKLDNKDLEYFGSRGEQRTAVLELKLAELNFFKALPFPVRGGLAGIVPVLLLDDVFSELDETHRDYVISIIGNQQTILSTVEESQIPKKFLKEIKIVKVEKGKITF